MPMTTPSILPALCTRPIDQLCHYPQVFPSYSSVHFHQPSASEHYHLEASSKPLANEYYHHQETSSKPLANEHYQTEASSKQQSMGTYEKHPVEYDSSIKSGPSMKDLSRYLHSQNKDMQYEPYTKESVARIHYAIQHQRVQKQ